MTDLIQELEELLRTHGVSGFEDDISNLITKKISVIKGLPKPYLDDLGNLIVTLNRDKDLKHVVLVAHMDELGMLVANINDDGSLSIRKIGGIDDRTLVSRVVNIRTRKGVVPGIIGLKPPHLMEDRSEMKSTIPAKDLRVDVGTKSKRETEALGIGLLDPMVLKKDLEIMRKKIIVGRGLDDRFGCLGLLEILRKIGPKSDRIPLKMSFVWSVQEEIGLRGAFAIANTLRPDYVFAIDSGSTTDAPAMPKGLNPFMMGEGPGLRLVDDRAIASPKLRRYLNRIAKRYKIPLQEMITGGSTDAAAIQSIGCAAIPVAIPLRYTHSTVECIHIDDLVNLIRLMVRVLENIGKDPG